MLQIHAPMFYWVATLIQQMSSALKIHDSDTILSNDLRADLAMRLRLALDHAEKLALPVTKRQIERLLSNAVKNDCTPEDLSNDLTELTLRFIDELEDRLLFHIPMGQAKYLTDPLKEMGPAIIHAFPSISFDTEEGCKCLALGRATASVFHMMRIMESGLRVVAKELNIDVPTNRSWDSILKKIGTAIEQQRARDEWTEFYAEVKAKGYAVKDAWRNPTLHVEKKHTSEEAEDIFHAVRGFMRHLATKLSETSP